MNIKYNIPKREIGEDETELLEQLWADVSGMESSEAPLLAADFEDLQRRLRKETYARRRRRLITGGGIAALLAGCLFALYVHNTSVPAMTPIAQLRGMGVSIDDSQVILTMDNRQCISLDSAASIEHSPDDIALRTSEGEKLPLTDKHTLKLSVPAGKHFQMTLSDGTKVWLNASSSLEYPASFEGKTERRVKLVGEAFFEVKRNEDLPFYVEVGPNESIRVLGTSFNVNAYSESKEHVTTLLSGRISYSFHQEREAILLAPDQQVRFDCDKGKTEVAQVDASAYAAWKDGWIYFEDESLETLALRLSRMYGIRIEIDDRLKSCAFSGKISYDRGVDYITRLMSETAGIVCQVEDGVIKLK